MRFLPILLTVSVIACTKSATPDGGVQPGPGDNATAAVPPASVEPIPLKLTSFKVHDALGNTSELNLSSLKQLTIDSAYRAAPGNHAQQVDVIDPSGVLYGRVSNQVPAGSDGAASSSRVLQVAGSTIEHYQMTGAWQFVLSVDGVALASVTVDIVK